jgi:hypothetical protein
LVAYDRQSVAVSTIRSRRCIIRIPNCSIQHDPRSLIGYAVETDNGDDDREVYCFSSAQPPSSPPPPTSKRTIIVFFPVMRTIILFTHTLFYGILN